MDEWHIGDPVDWGDGFMDAQNWGRSYDDDKRDSDKSSSQYSKRDEYSKRAWDYFMDNNFDDALYYIDMALDLDYGNANNWNRKAIVLEYMKRYEESERCYNKSLELYPQSLVYDNKARMLRDWAGHLFKDAINSQNRLPKLEKALKINRKAIDVVQANNGEETVGRYLSQKHIIENTIGHENEYQRNAEALKAYDRSQLFTITGRRFHDTSIKLTIGMPLRLVKEPDNQFDRNAIAVYAEDKKVGYVANNVRTKFELNAEDKKVGYVANNVRTKFELTSSASELQNKIGNTARAEYLAYLFRPTDLQYYDIQLYIGRIIK